MDVFWGWWACRRRIRSMEAALARAGVQRSDPMYPLIKEMATIPDRLLRVGIILLSLLVAAMAVGWLGRADATATPGLTVLPGNSPRSTIFVFSAAGGSRWLPCPQFEKRHCLEVFSQPTLMEKK